MQEAGIPLMDTQEFSDACFALCKAEQYYKPENKVMFSTFAYVCAQREIFKIRKKDKKRLRSIDEEDYFNLPDHRRKSPEENLEFKLESVKLKKALKKAKLGRRNRDILIRRFAHSWRLSDLAAKYNVSKERARQIVEVSLEKVRAALGEE